MAIVHGYCNLDELKRWVQFPSGDVIDDATLEDIVTATSRTIDGYCGRRFWLDPTAVARTFRALDLWVLSVPDIGVSTGVAVDLDNDGDGIFETPALEWQLEPVDAPFALTEAQPWDAIRILGSSGLPVGSLGARQERVQVTAQWGWPEVPAGVKQACLMQSARMFKRRYSPEGVAGFGEFGVVRVSRVDPDVEALLAPYRLTELVAG